MSEYLIAPLFAAIGFGFISLFILAFWMDDHWSIGKLIDTIKRRKVAKDSIGNVCVYGRELTQDEIRFLYSLGPPPTEVSDE